MSGSNPPMGDPAPAPAQGSNAEAPRQKLFFSLPAKVLMRLFAVWVAASGILYWISRSDWWLCALGGLGAILVVWPGPAARS